MCQQRRKSSQTQVKKRFPVKILIGKKSCFSSSKEKMQVLSPSSLSLSRVFLPFSLSLPLPFPFSSKWISHEKDQARPQQLIPTRTPIFTGTFSFFFLLFLQRDGRHRLKMWMCANGFARLPEGGNRPNNFHIKHIVFETVDWFFHSVRKLVRLEVTKILI